MCLAAPGPRCHGHASAKAEKLEGQVQEAEVRTEELKTALAKIAKKHPKNHASRYDYQQTQERLWSAGDKLNSFKLKHRRAVEELDSTVGGIEDLETRIATLNPALDEEVQEHDALVKRLENGKATYTKKLREYDYERGTVDGRNPSPYGSDKGIHILAKRKKDLVAKASGLTSEAKAEHDEKIAALEEQLAHARKTRDWASAGITDKASASLAANKENLKTAEKGLKDALKKEADLEKHYNETYAAPMAAIRENNRKEGRTLMVQFPLEDKRKFRALRDEADEYSEEYLKPVSYEIAKYEGMSNTLKAQIKLGSISPKKRAENRKTRNRF